MDYPLTLIWWSCRASLTLFRRYPNTKLNWLVLPESERRDKVTTDVATGSSTYDIVTVGMFEAPIWAANGWISAMPNLASEYPDNVQKDYDFNDLLPGVVAGLSYEGKLYAAPFYGESSMLFYNKAMFKEAGLEMPAQPTWV